MFADPKITLVSSTIISLLWIYNIYVTGVLSSKPWLRRLRTFKYFYGFGIEDSLENREFFPLQTVSYSQNSCTLITAALSYITSP